MKKILAILGSFIMVLPLIVGCSTTNQKFDEQIVKMEKVLQEGKIYEDDYSIQAENYEDDETIESVSLKKNGKNIYYNKTQKNSSTTIWVGEKDGKYYIYKNINDKKTYREVLETDIAANLKLLGVNVDELAKNYLEIINSQARKITLSCKAVEKSSDCEFEKSLFGGKVSIESEHKQNGITNLINITIKKGKPLNYEEVIKSSTTNKKAIIDVDYGKQKISLPDIEGFTKVN